MTVITDQATSDPPSFDLDLTPRGSATTVWDNPYLEWMGVGDIDKYGPRGTNAFSFQLTTTVPDQYLTGGLASGWTFNANPYSLTITLKHGIMWTGNTNIGMASRELTSADCVFSGNRTITAPTAGTTFNWIKDVVAVDKYTYRWDFNSYYANWEFFLIYGGSLGSVFTPESANAGGADWRNQTGTGPFILTDYVSGADATYTRNPNYWGTTTINGKQYQLPFINKLIYPVITDSSTELAALRTGKIDIWSRVPLSQGATLATTSPALVQDKWISGQVDIFYENRLGNDPLNNLAVRQAMMEATDFNTVMKLVWGDGNILGWPVSSSQPSYTPLSKQPAIVQQLFTYNPSQAKQMLAAAGYPNGFTTSIDINSADPAMVNLATVCVAEWAQVGVTATINAMPLLSLTTTKTSVAYNGFLCWSIATANPLTPLTYYQAGTTGGEYKAGEPLDVESTACLADSDPAKLQADVKQFCQDALTDAAYMPFADPYILNCYWPWLKNYYGEVDTGYHNQIPMISRIWIDTTLKSSLGH
jgi:peptide/nickel transport system substrate-binding protein